METVEQMFEKTLTPSDVGKLNRLVIPKQFAERYFPLGSGVESGILLSFRDEAGKCWQFRYSYWRSSQSYVLTKGWSGYVKEKGLTTGDVVVFGRLRANNMKVIGFRKRLPAPSAAPPFQPNYPNAGELRVSQIRRSSQILRLFGVNVECSPMASPDDVNETLSRED